MLSKAKEILGPRQAGLSWSAAVSSVVKNGLITRMEVKQRAGSVTGEDIWKGKGKEVGLFARFKIYMIAH